MENLHALADAAEDSSIKTETTIDLRRHWPASARRIGALRTIGSMLDSGFVEVVSFDVFDTLVWREYRKPTDAFFDLHAHLCSAGVELGCTARTFAEARVVAERAARESRWRRSGGTEVNLVDIYNELARVLGQSSLDPESLAELETDFEAAILHPDAALVELVAHLRADRAIKLAVTSDTYFSPPQLLRLLAANGYPSDTWHSVFCSSAVGVGKGDGLFDRVIGEFGFSERADRVLHIGDNPAADVQGAGKSGVQTLHWPVEHEATAELVEFEVGIKSPPAGHTTPAEHHLRRDPLRLVHTRNGATSTTDRGTTAIRSRMQFAGLSGNQRIDNGIDTPQNRWGRITLGPIMDGFARWVAAQSEADGLDELYFFQREGAFLSELVEGALTATGVDTRCHVSPVSRFALLPSRFESFNAEYIETLATTRRAPRGSAVIRAAGFSTTPAGLEELAVRELTTPDDVSALAAALTSRPDIIDEGQRTLDEKRRRINRFVKAHFDLSAPTVGVVDLGWGGSIQTSLRAALTAVGYPGSVVGYYLATNDAATHNITSSNRMRGMIANLGAPHDVRALFRNPEILEQCCLENTGSVTGYGPHGEPMRGESTISAAQWREIAEIQRGALQYQRSRLAHVKAHPGCTLAINAAADPELVSDMVVRVAAAPTREEIEMFRDWRHDDNFGSPHSERLLPEYVAGGATIARQHLTNHLGLNELMWQAGAQARQSAVSADLSNRCLDVDIQGSVSSAARRNAPLANAVAVLDDSLHFAAYAAATGDGLQRIKLAIVLDRSLVQLNKLTVETEIEGQTHLHEINNWIGVVRDPTTRLLGPELAQVRSGVLRLRLDIVPRPDGRFPTLARVNLDCQVQPYRTSTSPAAQLATKLSARRLTALGGAAGNKLAEAVLARAHRVKD